METKIKVSTKALKNLQLLFGVSRATTYQCLCYNFNNSLARHIRVRALNYENGKIIKTITLNKIK